MFTHELESAVACNFNCLVCLIEAKGLLNVTGSHAHCIAHVAISWKICKRDIATCDH